MFAQIAVLTYQPPDIDSYTYEIPKDLEGKVKIGHLVSVPFGKRTPMGIIIHLRGVHPARLASKRATSEVSGKIAIKPISSIVSPIPLLLPYQIELLEWMAFYYHAPMVNCLEAMIPTKALNAKRLMTNAKTISQSVSRSSLVVSQTIVLVPSINRIPEALASYPQAKNYAIYHNELKSPEKLNAWFKILSDNADFVFGSRSVIFAPCPNLAKIEIYDEHDSAYKDERSPYYSTLTIAEKIQELTGARLKIIDSSPKITTYFNHKQNVILEPLTPVILTSSRARGKNLVPVRGKLRERISNTKVQIISMLTEKAAGNRLPISDTLETYIKLGFKKKKRILLFLNKKTESGHVYCRNCKYSEFATTAPEVCPNCRSFEIWFNSVNVNSLANLVKKLVPNAMVKIISTQLPNYPTTQLPTIDIATASVFYKLLPHKYDLVAHIQTDSLTNITDLRSAEKLFAQIISLKKITRGLLLLQTYNALDPTIISASLGNYQKFFQDQLAQRQALSYPPFSLLVKLTLRGKEEENLEEKASKLYAELNQLTVNSELSTVSILGPYKPQFTGKTAKYNIILKLPLKNYSLGQREMAIKAISPQLSLVPHGWQVEVEAQSIR